MWSCRDAEFDPHDDFIIVENGLIAIGGGAFVSLDSARPGDAFVVVRRDLDSVPSHSIGWCAGSGHVHRRADDPAGVARFGLPAPPEGSPSASRCYWPSIFFAPQARATWSLWPWSARISDRGGVAWAALFSFIAGGVLALLFALGRVRSPAFRERQEHAVRHMLTAMTTGKTTITTPAVSVGKLPYGVRSRSGPSRTW